MSISAIHDGVYSSVTTPATTPAPGNPNLPSFLLGTASWGKLNTPYLFSSPAQLKDAFGELTQATNNITTQGLAYLAACSFMGKSGNCYGSRVSDGTDTAAVININDTVAPTPGIVLAITGLSSGTRGNSGSALVSVGSASTTSKPTYNITLSIGFGLSETFTNIIAWKLTANVAAFDSPTFVLNAINVINNGSSYSRGKSQYWFASAPNIQSALVPAIATFSAAGGTDGSAPTSSQLLGVDGLSARTGVYAERGLNVGQFAVAGLTDMTVSGPYLTFAAPPYKLFVQGYPLGTSVAGAQTIKQANSLTSINHAQILGQIQFFDYTIGQNRFISGDGFALGIISSRSPEQSPGNQPVVGSSSFVLGTDRYGVPFADAELDVLAGSGIIAIGPLARNATLIGLVGGQNASGIPGQDGVNYTRLTGYVVKTLRNISGPYVDSLQSTRANDPTRRLFKGALDNFLNGLKQNFQIDSFNVVSDLTNNSPNSIAAGQLNANIQIRYLGTVRFINLNINAGVAVVIDVTGTTQVTAAA